MTLGLDGSAVKDPESGTSGPLPIRSLSFSEPRPPAGKTVRPPTLNTLKVCKYLVFMWFYSLLEYCFYIDCNGVICVARL